MGVISNLLRASELGPGYVPFGWAPPNSADRARLQFCQACQSYKAPRSHHCRKCARYPIINLIFITYKITNPIISMVGA